jgi:hypothetical protein
VPYVGAVAGAEVDVQRAVASRELSQSSTVDPAFFLAVHEIHGRVV